MFLLIDDLKFDVETRCNIKIDNLNGDTVLYTYNGKKYRTTARAYHGKKYNTKSIYFAPAGFCVKYFWGV